MEETKVNNYESVVILNPSLSEEKQKEILKKNKGIIESFDGALNHVDSWGSRSLANPIEKVYRGSYYHLTFKANNKCVAELERTMKINDGVLRFIHVRLDNAVSLQKHVEDYKEILLESKKRLDEKEAKIAAKKAGGPMNKKPRRPVNNR